MNTKLTFIIGLLVATSSFAQVDLRREARREYNREIRNINTEPVRGPQQSGQRCQDNLCTGDLVGVQGSSGSTGGAGYVAAFSSYDVTVQGFDNRLYSFSRSQLSSPGLVSQGISAGMQVAVVPSSYISNGAIVGEGVVIGVYNDGSLAIKGFDSQFYTFPRAGAAIPSGCTQNMCVDDLVYVRTGGYGYLAGFFPDGSVALRGMDNNMYSFSYSQVYR